ncbi:MAG: 30S ribosomal protein S17 [Rhodospirillales bacterium]
MPKRIMQGVVVSDKMEKTIVVNVERKFPHSLYKKFIKRSKRYHVHDKDNQFKMGDIVKIQECRPLSKSKRWEVISGSR